MEPQARPGLLYAVKYLGIRGEWGYPAAGVDTDGDGRLEYDCSGLISEALKLMGCKFNRGETRLSCQVFLKRTSWFKPITKRKDLKRHDIVVFEVGAEYHSGVVEWYDPNTGNGEMWTARPDRFGGIGYCKFGPWSDVDYFQKFRARRWVTCVGKPPKKPKMWLPPRRHDPLILNFDGDGIQTLGLDAGIHFDHDGNGFKELTGWAAPGNGILMLDRNGDGLPGNGGEIFGDFTALDNGMMAANGFEALAQFDSNNDGKIDANDEIWSRLRIWEFNEGWDGDLGDPDISGKVSTLDELGISAIFLDSQIVEGTDGSGNTEVRTGQFEWADGRTGTIAEYRLQLDTTDTIPTELLDVSPEIEALPNLPGYGNVPDLDQAMMADFSGQLRALNEAFAVEQSIAGREAILGELMFKWAGVDTVAPDARGPFMDGRKVVLLEKFYGDPPVNPDAGLATLWEDTYRELFETFYGNLMAETHLKDLYDTITYTWNDVKGELDVDTSALVAALQDEVAADPEKGKELLSEFARSRRGMGYFSENCFLSVREAFIQQDPSLGWVFDTGGLPVYDQLGQGDGTYYPHMWGTDNADAVRGSATEGDGVINGMNGNDVIYATDRDEVLYNQTGDALLVGGGGNDRIWAGDGNDILDGGPGCDTLHGEAGDDTYILRVGSGQDTIIETDTTPGNMDTIWIGSFLTPDEVAVRRSANDLVVKIIGTEDTMTVKYFFDTRSVSVNAIERIVFSDGTTWDVTEILRRQSLPTEGEDYLVGDDRDDVIDALGGDDIAVGLAENDTLMGGTGRDKIFGGDGDDLIEGGSGNDELEGGAGSDVYVLRRGDGHDVIRDLNGTDGSADTVVFVDILPSDVSLSRTGNDLIISIAGTDDWLTLKACFTESAWQCPIEKLTFSDGTEWDTGTIKDLFLRGTEGHDLITGFYLADFIEGPGDNDIISGGAGDDILDHGCGPLSARHRQGSLRAEPTRRGDSRGYVSDRDLLHNFWNSCWAARFDPTPWSRRLPNLGTPCKESLQHLVRKYQAVAWSRQGGDHFGHFFATAPQEAVLD